MANLDRQRIRQFQKPRPHRYVSFIYPKDRISKHHRPSINKSPLSKKQMINLLRTSVDEWNAFREQYPHANIELQDTDLRDAYLDGVDLSHVDLTNAKLDGAFMQYANMQSTILNGASLTGTFLYRAIMSRAELWGADASNACFRQAGLRRVCFRSAIISGADFSEADLKDADVRFVECNQASMDGHYFNVDLEGCFGNPIFIRDAHDQAFIDSVRQVSDHGWRKLMFRLWAFTNYGRSITRVALFAVICVSVFGVLYCIPGTTTHRGHWMDPTPFYFSAVTFTTLGYGDVAANSFLGQCLVVLEVVFGYVTLGLLLSILANQVARRA